MVDLRDVLVIVVSSVSLEQVKDFIN